MTNSLRTDQEYPFKILKKVFTQAVFTTYRVIIRIILAIPKSSLTGTVRAVFPVGLNGRLTSPLSFIHARSFSLMLQAETRPIGAESAAGPKEETMRLGLA